MSRITNETLAALMTQRFDQMDERVDALTTQVKETNGRLRTAEKDIAVLQANSNGGGFVAIPKKWIVVALAAGGAIGAFVKALWPALVRGPQ